MSDAEKLRELEALITHAASFDIERNKRWVVSSHRLAVYDPFIVVTIQGLGKLDAKLIVEDENIVKHKKPSSPFGDVSDHITLSYLWVLGAYEVIRALDQRAREDKNFLPQFKKEVQELKFEFERIRIPLAKFESAKRFSETDRHIAYPGFHQELGTSWQVAENTWVNRRTLSDKMLSLFEVIGA